MKKVFTAFVLLAVMATGTAMASPDGGIGQKKPVGRGFGVESCLSQPVWIQSEGNTGFSLNNFIWEPALGYTVRPYYQKGFSVGSLLSLGFAEKGTRLDISDKEYREPTWAIHGGLGLLLRPKYWLLIEPIFGFGWNVAKRYTLNDATGDWSMKKKGYFGMEPAVLVSIYMVYAKVGYEFVPKFKQLNGVVWSVGISIPLKPEWAGWRAALWSL